MSRNNFPQHTGKFQCHIDKEMHMTKKQAFRYHKLNKVKKRFLVKKISKANRPFSLD